MVSTCRNNHRLSPIALFSLCIPIVHAWSGPNSSHLQEPIDRRVMVSKVSAVVAGGLAFAGLETASAIDVASSPEDFSFNTYNIIPDASASLDPRLVQVDNTKFIRDLTCNSSGGSIWLGEHHNAQKDHTFQAEFIRKARQERVKQNIKGHMAIGLEQVQTQFQPVLDDYVKGRINLAEMRKKVQWDKRWTWDFEGYKSVFETARDLKIRLLALNVDSEDLTEVEKGGYPGLPLDRLRKYIKDPVGFGNFAKARQFSTYVDYVISPSYEIHQKLGLLSYSITGEKMDEEMPFRNFLSGRILWDEGMASAAYSWSCENPGGLLIGLVGADHVKFCNGIPGRFARMAKGEFDCTTVVINPTLIDSRPFGSVADIAGAESSQYPDRITLQLRYLKDDIDPKSDDRRLPESTGGVLPFSNYIVIT